MLYRKHFITLKCKGHHSTWMVGMYRAGKRQLQARGANMACKAASDTEMWARHASSLHAMQICINGLHITNQ